MTATVQFSPQGSCPAGHTLTKVLAALRQEGRAITPTEIKRTACMLTLAELNLVTSCCDGPCKLLLPQGHS